MICIIFSRGDFWVGKQSLRGWKQMALKEIDDKIEKLEKEGSENGMKPKPEENKLETVKNEADSTSKFLIFNSLHYSKKVNNIFLRLFFPHLKEQSKD